MEAVLLEAAERLKDNFPYFHPLYAGQMLKPPHPVARLAYALAMWINPNNHALDGGRASSAMEREAVAGIARMFGWGAKSTSATSAAAGRWRTSRRSGSPGGSTRARRSSRPRRRTTRTGASAACWASRSRRSRATTAGASTRARSRAGSTQGGVGTVVATMGTTATGSVDPLPEILALKERHGFRLHADAAYGGYYGLADNLGAPARRAFDRIGEADSIVIDPHKHGLQPYGCGCVLFRDPAVGRLYKHDSPYTYFSSTELHLGEISLECSRPGASAVALWATMRLLPLEKGGAFAGRLSASRQAALALHGRLAADARFLPPFEPELDIVVWAVRAASVTASSALARRVFDEAARRGLHLALVELPVAFFDLAGAGIERDRDTVTCLRSVLMKPEHREWLDRIWSILDAAAGAAR